MLKKFIEHVVKELVEKTDAVHVTERQEDSTTIFEVHVAPEDLGKVIGKSGTTIRAIRAVVCSVGSDRGQNIRLDVAK